MPKTLYSVKFYDAAAHPKEFGAETVQFFKTKLDAVLFAGDVDADTYETHQLCSSKYATYLAVGSTLI